jgi:uncharacterized protein
MPLTINLRHLEKKNVVLEGELTAEELGLEGIDELVHPSQPLKYQIEAERMEQSVLVQGSLKLPVQCECARCLKPFAYDVEIPEWVCHLPLEGEDKVVVTSDSVDLTPYIREDILLGFPQHPLCSENCSGLPDPVSGKEKDGAAKANNETSSAWSELNKLKF